MHWSVRSVIGLVILFAGLTAGGDDRPNILVLVADDLGWADVGYHGSKLPTPNIDRLVREGVELDQHYVAPMCTPTRAALLTGRYWSRFGNRKPSNERVLPYDTMTLAKALKQQGYRTHLTGKWHLGSKLAWGPQVFGFDASHGPLAGGVGPWNHRYKKGDYSKTWQVNGNLLHETGHVTDLIGNQAVRWIHEAAETDEPFFVYVPFTAPHSPLQEPAEWIERAASIAPEDRVQYTACVMHLDYTIGRILTALEHTGHVKNTLTVLFSDNGGTIGPSDGDNARYPGAYPKGEKLGRNEPLRGRKGQLYEGGIRVPAVAHWPGKLSARKLPAPVHVIDWMPTLAGLAGFEQEEDLKWDGEDLWPVLTGAAEPKDERVLYWQGTRLDAHAIRAGNWKLIVNGEKLELFDLSRDPNETDDLAEVHPAKVDALLQKLDKARKKDNDALPLDDPGGR